MWPFDDEPFSQKLTGSASTGALDHRSCSRQSNRSCSRQSNRPMSRQDERPCSRQGKRPGSRQSMGNDERPCSRRSVERDGPPPSRQSNLPLSRQSISRTMLAPLEKTPSLPEGLVKIPLDVASQLTIKSSQSPAASLRSALFPEYYRRHIAPSCGKAFWSVLFGKFTKVEKEKVSMTSASQSVPLLRIPSRPGTAVESRPGSAAGLRTPKPQVMLSGGKLHVVDASAGESSRFGRPDSAAKIKMDKCSEEFQHHIYAEDMKILSPCLACLTVN